MLPHGPAARPPVAAIRPLVGLRVTARPARLSSHATKKGILMRRASGFTLIEVMITIAIIAIIAAIAIPSYTDYVTRGKLAEATTTLSDLRVKLEQYYQDNRMYNKAGASPVCGGWTNATTPPGGVNTKYFQMQCASSNASGAGDQSYTVTATGSDGNVAGFTYTVDQTNTKTTVIAAPANTGKWGTGNASCWIIKPQSC
jgi:type IV pilus assembly protein PilE